jgi:hypothetical protein
MTVMNSCLKNITLSPDQIKGLETHDKNRKALCAQIMREHRQKIEKEKSDRLKKK